MRPTSPQNVEEATADHGDEQRESSAADISACKSCRNRKLKCSRELPSCSQCSRLSCPCVYDRNKNKRGLKSGAVESLSRRIRALEEALTSGNLGEIRPASPVSPQGCLYHAALLIANSIGENIGYDGGLLHEPAPLKCNTDEVTSPPSSGFLHANLASSGTKRRRTNRSIGAVEDQPAPLPPEHILEAVLEAYFTKIHPWLPCVHQNTFKARLANPQEARKLTVVTHAMICAAMKHLRVEDVQMEEEEQDRQVQASRDAVTRLAMTSMSLESVQALVIIASDYMGDGNLASAWPIIGSLSRTVEYLQLSIEVDEQPHQGFLRALTVLEDSPSWAVAEERRRAFWNVFILDRLCSIMTGWNTSLTSEDVRRRLPSDGKIWARGERAITPYFGIWNKYAAKIGNPISLCQDPRSPLSPDSIPAQRNETSPASESLAVGAFAYRIEATESLSQVISYFLRQPINFRNRQDVGSWLTRFKELDLRLVHWKAFLPPKFKDSDTSHDRAVVTMDPNLTLAHTTHNASMILLHQHIAYPPVELQNIVRLPSSCSAETCQLAAIETSSIAQKFLTYTEFEIVVAQFPFCVFVAARVLLVHWKVSGSRLANEFFILLDCLRDMSRMWQGLPSTPSRQASVSSKNKDHLDLAAKYASLLEAMHSRSLNDPGLLTDEIFQFDITCDLGVIRSGSISWPISSVASTETAIEGCRLPTDANYYNTAANSSLAAGWGAPEAVGCNHMQDRALNLNAQKANSEPRNSYSPPSAATMPAVYSRLKKRPAPDMTSAVSWTEPRHPEMALDPITGGDSTNGMRELTEDELTAMSDGLLGQSFSELDRVITLDGTDFNYDISHWGMNELV